MSSASKFIRFGTALFRFPKLPISPSPPPSLLSLKPFSASQPILFSRHCSSSSAAAVSSVDAATSSSREAPVHHPWPEWVAFVDGLKTKGYFLKPLPPAEDGETDGVYNDMNQLKDACLSFARDRFDVFKSLSVQDIQALVEGGCPNLLRKPVNSGKRLRFYVKLDEGDVCGGCNLRGSCDRAYVVLNEFEAAARTVDIVRILMYYALDPLVISGQQKPPGRELVETSARKLLARLLQLSETDVDPSLPMPAAKAFPKKKPSIRLMDDELSQAAEMKRGDWMCPKCNFLNFVKNIRCLECKEEGPRKVDMSDVEMKKGDWVCSECKFMNFARNVRCLKCEAQGPKRPGVDDVKMKKGDWNCPQCGFMNFASKKNCFRCQEVRPKQNPADWDCPSCNFMNYSRNTECLKCKCERPDRDTTVYPKKKLHCEYEEHVWRRPR
ncbi:hypothetical protein ACLB2K_052328 [Fragaria x ananassa]